MIISIHVPLNIYRMGWILLLIIPDHIQETRKFSFQPWINSVTTFIRSRLILITLSAGGRGWMLQKGTSFSFLPDQNFVIDPFLCSGDRMTGMWRAYQSLMSRYPWTVQIVTAGRKKSTLLHICQPLNQFNLPKVRTLTKRTQFVCEQYQFKFPLEKCQEFQLVYWIKISMILFFSLCKRHNELFLLLWMLLTFFEQNVVLVAS